MRNLKLNEVLEVNGGEGETASGGETPSQTVANNAATAQQVCGPDNVKSVTTEGFECR